MTNSYEASVLNPFMNLSGIGVINKDPQYRTAGNTNRGYWSIPVGIRKRGSKTNKTEYDNIYLNYYFKVNEESERRLKKGNIVIFSGNLKFVPGKYGEETRYIPIVEVPYSQIQVLDNEKFKHDNHDIQNKNTQQIDTSFLNETNNGEIYWMSFFLYLPMNS